MERKTELRRINDIQVIEGLPPEVSQCPEENIAMVLDWLSNIKQAWVRIDYTILGDKQQMTTETLKRDPSDKDEDRNLFLLQKAQELMQAEEYKITLVNPDKPEQEIRL